MQADAISSYAKQKRDGFPLLRFNANLEQEFRSWYKNRNLKLIQVASLGSMIIFFAFVGLDILTLPESVLMWSLPIRLGIVCPTFFMLFLVARNQPRYEKLLTPLSAFSVIASGGGTVGVLFVAHSHGIPLPYEGLIILITYPYFFTALLFPLACIGGVSVLVMYVGVEYLLGMPSMQLVYQASFLLTMNVIGIVGCYVFEHVMRDNFLTSQMLTEFAQKDPLTELFNRRAFSDNYHRIWRQAVRDKVPLAIILADVDYFKNYNDLYGHVQGDDCLREVAKVMSHAVNRPFDMVARYGGEEFVILCFDARKNFAEELSENIRRGVFHMNSSHEGSDVADRVTITLGGIVAVPEANCLPNEFIRLADEALYRAKEAGRNQVAFAENKVDEDGALKVSLAVNESASV
ncbi:MAG: hypothetical protein COB04_00775 [Gammaproteobacteria bacterium]|nr:MAG: hypothetical protein COB04_00775 [Gammaproteobacteria bacterium]